MIGSPTRLSPAADPGQDETVLVINDEPTVRMLVAVVPEEAGYARASGLFWPADTQSRPVDAGRDVPTRQG